MRTKTEEDLPLDLLGAETVLQQRQGFFKQSRRKETLLRKIDSGPVMTEEYFQSVEGKIFITLEYYVR